MALNLANTAGRVLDNLELPGCHPVGHHCGGVNRGIVPVTQCSLAAIAGLFSFKILKNKVRASIIYYVCVDSSPPGHVVVVEEAFRIKERQHHYFFLVAWTLTLIGPGLLFSSHLFTLLLSLRCVE